jgi:D-lactate dehydrogenase
MRVAIFSTQSYDRTFFQAADAADHHEMVFFEPRLTLDTVSFAAGFPAICPFVNDQLSVVDRKVDPSKGILPTR